MLPVMPHGPRKLKLATVSLAGCFGCHMSLLDIDERLIALLEHIEIDCSPLTDKKHCEPCDVGLIEGGLCNAENVHKLREFRKNCTTLVAVGACAINGGPFIDSPEVHNGVDCLLPVDLYIPGCPPHPVTILDGLLRLLGKLEGD